MNEYLANFNIVSWLMDNILWFFVFTVCFVGVCKFIIILFRATFISRKLLSQNRDTLGNAWGTHFADRFVDMWYSTNQNSVKNFGKEFYLFKVDSKSRHLVEAIDRRLNEFKLIERDGDTYDAVFKSVRNCQNRMILFIVEFWLVRIVGDNKDVYKELKSRRKNSK